ncbi:hypothetical protein AFCDBAGC_3829 [Methylobacterium cerastii]|uniref:Uncharacterized protein n=1 Tax=Methylobacterium cerastii TaxID=932741 RepID=A0ABQ4QMJ0_9HYPH|nr:hypothetical protein AFCDBAGC_3829 [Methylobacterium cerastii]
MPPTAASKSSAICRIPALRCASAASRASAVSASSLRVRIRFSLNTWTADAIAPISSRRAPYGTAISASPAASPDITPVIAWIGRETRRRLNAAAAQAATSARTMAQ